MCRTPCAYPTQQLGHHAPILHSTRAPGHQGTRTTLPPLLLTAGFNCVPLVASAYISRLDVGL